MLQSIRDNAQGVLVWIVVGLIVVSFALFGLGSYLSGASKVVAASVNDTEISSSALTRAYQNYQERLRQMFGEQYRPEMFDNKQMKSQVLQGLITQEVMNQMLFDQGYKASTEQIVDKLKSYEAFHQDGQFSAARYKEVLSLQGLNEESFEHDISQDIASQQIRSAITDSAFLTEKEKNTLAALENQKREVAYFDIKVQAFKNATKVTDEEIKSSYEENSQLYLTEEKVQLEYLELNMDAVAARQDITDEMIKLHYESSPESYMARDNRAAEIKISNLRKQIIKGANFAELAKEYSHDKASAKQGGDLGYVTQGIEDNFDKAVFALKKGEVSQVIKSNAGFQLVQLDDIRAGDPEERKVRLILIKPENKLKPLADVKVSIIKELQYQQAGKVFFDDADQMGNLSYESPDSLQPVADTLGLKVITSDFITRRGAAGILSHPKVLAAAFSPDTLKEGRNSEILELSDSQLVVLRVKEHKTSSVKPLAEVQSQVKSRLVHSKASKKVAEVSSDILARVNNNESISAIIQRHKNVKWNKAGLIARKADKDSTIPAQVRAFAFAMAKPVNAKTNWDKVSLSSGDQAVIALSKVNVANVTLNDTERYNKILGNTDYESFVKYLKSQADISISQAAIDTEVKQ